MFKNIDTLDLILSVSLEEGAGYCLEECTDDYWCGFSLDGSLALEELDRRCGYPVGTLEWDSNKREKLYSRLDD
jgi:hypothetical protein